MYVIYYLWHLKKFRHRVYLYITNDFIFMSEIASFDTKLCHIYFNVKPCMYYLSTQKKT